MANTKSFLGRLDSDVSVTVCDTPIGRTIVVSRALTLRLR
jgi:hypothetical protein